MVRCAVSRRKKWFHFFSTFVSIFVGQAGFVVPQFICKWPHCHLCGSWCHSGFGANFQICQRRFGRISIAKVPMWSQSLTPHPFCGFQVHVQCCPFQGWWGQPLMSLTVSLNGTWQNCDLHCCEELKIRKMT